MLATPSTRKNSRFVWCRMIAVDSPIMEIGEHFTRSSIMTKNDLTAQFLEAHSRASAWIEGGFDLVLTHLRAHPHVTINWDHGVPEHWVGIHWDGEDSASL